MLISKRVALALVSFFTLAVFFGLYATSASVVFASFVRSYYCIPHGEGKVECCSQIKGTQWCTICDDTKPPSNCGSRFPEPLGVAPPPPSTSTCPKNTAVDANGKCAPLTQGPQTPSTTTPKDTTGAIEQPPSANLAQQPKSQTICPDGSAPDANSQCPTTGNQNPQSLANNNIII